MHCTMKLPNEPGVNISFSAVYSGSEENDKFFKATPGGHLDLFTVNKEFADTIELGKEYYIDISSAG